MPPNHNNSHFQIDAYWHIRPITQPCWPRLSCHPISMVYIDTSDLTRHRADLVCHATYSLATHHHGVATNQTFQALIGNVSHVCLCRCTNMYIIHSIITSINSSQAYIIKPTQYLNNYITFQNVTRQWPLTAAEQQSFYSDIQAHCSGEHQQLGHFHPSQLVTVRTTLVAASALCLSQTEHEIWKSIYYSQSEPSRCGENPTCWSECSQHQWLTKPSLLVAARIALAAASARNFHQL